MPGGKRIGAGRKAVKIDLGELEKLCSLQCTDEELAAWFKVAPRTIERRRKQAGFLDAMNRGRAKGRIFGAPHAVWASGKGKHGGLHLPGQEPVGLPGRTTQ